jgi:prevent-host-death family protein
MELLNITEADEQLSEVIDKAASGEEVLLGKDGQPVAKVVPIKAPKPNSNRRLGMCEGKIHIAKDFDEWPEEEARALGIID